MNTKNCQSCGMPLNRDENGGATNADGSRCESYCSHCFVGGRFTQPDLSVTQMQERVREKLCEFGIPRAFTWIFTRKIPKLSRWSGGRSF